MEIQLLKSDNISRWVSHEEDRTGLSWCLPGALRTFPALVETNCYGTDVIKTIISSYHSRACTAHSMIHASMMFEVNFSKKQVDFHNKMPQKKKVATFKPPLKSTY